MTTQLILSTHSGSLLNTDHIFRCWHHTEAVGEDMQRAPSIYWVRSLAQNMETACYQHSPLLHSTKTKKQGSTLKEHHFQTIT